MWYLFAQSTEVNQFYLQFFICPFVNLYDIHSSSTGGPVLWTRIHSSSEWLLSFWPWILGYKVAGLATRLLDWILGQVSQAKGLRLSQLNPNTSFDTSCLWNVIQIQKKTCQPVCLSNSEPYVLSRKMIIGSDTWSTFPFSLQPKVIKISELCKSIFAKLLSPIKTVTSPEWSFPVIAISDVTIHFNWWLKMGPTLPFIKR